LDAPFANKVHGVGIGDRLTHLLKMLGHPYFRREPVGTPQWEIYNYRLNDETVSFDIRNDIVRTVWLYKNIDNGAKAKQVETFRLR
jgi:hypothetical protein